MADLVVRLEAVRAYLERTTWRQEDADERTALWLPHADSAGGEDLHVVLPASEELSDAADLIERSLRVVAWAENRTVDEVRHDVAGGGADRLAVRLPADAFNGQVSLFTAPEVLAAVRNLVIGAAVGVEATEALVLPPRRPQRVEAYVRRAHVSTRPGSFIVDVELPGDEDAAPEALLQDPGAAPPPFGRRITTRLHAVADGAASLARRVGEGEGDVSLFADDPSATGNATELAALAQLGRGPFGASRYQLRFAQTPLWGPVSFSPSVIPVTPAQQSVLADAATYLRERRSRDGVTVTGLVVRLARSTTLGPGDVVVEGVDDDSGVTRRYAVNLSEQDYGDAARAHTAGFRVIVTGDLDVRGTRTTLRNIRSFDVLAEAAGD